MGREIIVYRDEEGQVRAMTPLSHMGAHLAETRRRQRVRCFFIIGSSLNRVR